jgi:ABC-type branched-subunit amino acid transport system substrate-binding protein
MILKAFAALTFLIFAGCSSQPVVTTHTTNRPATGKQAKSVKGADKKTDSKTAEVKKEEPLAPAAVAKPQPVEVKIVPKVQTPESLLKNANNLSIANNLIENDLSLNELEAAAADPALASFKPQLLLRIGKLYQKNKENERAGEYYRSLTTMYPQSVYSTQAAVLLATLQSSSEADANVIGAILPLTGRNSSVGQHALNAIRLGLGLNKDEKKFRIALYDSQSDPDMAAKGVEKLINDDKAIVILGGFSAKEAISIANKAELFSIPFIAFSQKPGLTNLGEYVFRNAMTPEMQIDRLVSFAFDKLSAKRFAILYPNDSYGVEFSNTFWDHVLARGGQVTAAQTYDPKTTDFSEPIQKMVGLYYDEARKDELKQRIEEMKAAAKKKEKENKNKGEEKPAQVRSSRDSISSENILPPIVDFDVVFIPDSSKALGQVLAFMKFNEVPDMNYLGTNLWNSTDLPARAANEDAGIYFSTAFDMNNAEAREGSFFKEYFETYNEEPTSVEAQVYEATKIVKDQIGSGIGGRESLAASLRGLGTVKGVGGDIEMNSQRELVHPVHILTLDSGVVKRAQ